MEKQDFLEKGYFYHIYNRGNNKENLFLEEDNYVYFLNLVSKYLLPVSDIYAYCLLKNHFHILLKIKDDLTVPDEKLHLPFSNLFNTYTKAINKKYNREGSLFKERYKRKRITDEKYLMQNIVYIHLNPIKHRFSEDFQGYFHSSFNALISNKSTKLKRKEVLELFGGKENFIDSHYMKIDN
ncbi:REP element-mobilizing transposase RayT [Paenimyroides aquimaris]|uniref:REP element-mobilizing transposase RayT n=1 Tax=Paenimyroides marinum TaxID=1159016 RepID=A0A1H6KE62_9FLAO|nr:transposase [Paenimyroides aquimaris]SEH73728.1 REP element-mobilizing transposase RayT [Paenimyroides aquimaris]